MHYTSIENIHKVIDPLFLDELKLELDEILKESVVKTKQRKLKEYQDKLATIVCLDPAAGSGNFLTESYLSLRRLENRVLQELQGGQMTFADTSASGVIKVSIGQFYGIEINDFAVTVARTALWIAENQMLQETESILFLHLDFLPLKSYPNIHEGNALGMDWKEVVPSDKVKFIMGNPPFVGSSYCTLSQKSEIVDLYGKIKLSNKSDFTYSVNIVYNNFPWPTVKEDQRKTIEKTAQGILDARALYPDSSLAELYDPDMMPPELVKAHTANDKAVLDAYGFKGTPAYTSEAACVAELMKMYQSMVEKNA